MKIIKIFLIIIIINLLNFLKSQNINDADDILNNEDEDIPKKPNFLFIISDDLRNDPFNRLDFPVRNLNNLASEGITFNFANAQMASCGPSRSSFLTGRRPDGLRYWSFESKHWRKSKTAFRSLPQLLRQNGYTTSAIGKVFHWDDNYKDDRANSWDYIKYTAPTDANEIKCPGGSYFCTCKSDGCADEILAKAAITRLDELKSSTKPFFLAVGFRRPHLDNVLPKNFIDNFPKVDKINLPKSLTLDPTIPKTAFYACQQLLSRGEVLQEAKSNNIQNTLLPDTPISVDLIKKIRQHYWASVSLMDINLGKILNKLKSIPKMNKKTIVIFFSDHGYNLGDKGMFCKQTNFELTVRVPLIIKVPWFQKISGGNTFNHPIELIDLQPTIAEFANIHIPDSCSDGTSRAKLFYDINGKYGGLKTPITANEVGIKSGIQQKYVAEFGTEYAISQFPRCFHKILTKNFLTKNNPYSNPCMKEKPSSFQYMGYTIRLKEWRYTEWRTWNRKKFIADWTPDGLVDIELYSHRGNDGSDIENFENINLANNNYYSNTIEKLSIILKNIVYDNVNLNAKCTIKTKKPTLSPIIKATNKPIIQPTNKPTPNNNNNNIPTLRPTMDNLSLSIVLNIEEKCTMLTTAQCENKLHKPTCRIIKGYGCHSMEFCSFKTNNRVKTERIAKRSGLKKGTRGCKDYFKRCKWEGDSCINKKYNTIIGS